MAYTFLTLLATALVLLISYLVKKYTYWRRRGIPTAKGLIPLLGHTWPLLTQTSNHTTLIENMHKEFKNCSMVGFYKMTSPVLLIRDPDLVKTVLQSNFSSFRENAAKLAIEADPLLTTHPFFTSGDIWLSGRKRLSHAFSSIRLRNILATVAAVCKKFEGFLNRRLKSTDKYEVELKYLFSKFTGEVVANVGFGIEGYCFEDESHPMAFDKIGTDIFVPSFFRGILVNIAFHFSQLNQIVKVGFLEKKMDQIFRRIVKENLEERQKLTTPRNDFIQLMIDLEKAEGQALDVDKITCYALSFYFDGYETSSATLTVLGYHLVEHPEIQEKLRKEVLTTLEKHGGELTYECLKEMTYMDQVISESQRQFPVFGTLSKACTEEFELQGSDGLKCRVKPGTEIVISGQALQMDPEHWQDPEVFDPDRFSADRKQSIKKMSYLPFGEGSRICSGRRMALLMVKVAIATLLKSFKLELSPKTKVPFKPSQYSILTMPEGGMWTYISKL